jgi:phosphoribosylformylglycinamidine cyclo-ligase
MALSPAYEAAGVNLEAGDNASNSMFKMTQQTWENRAGEFGEPEIFSEGFRGTRGVDLDRLFELHDRYPDAKFIQYHCVDGVGNKPKVAQRVGDHSTIGEDLVAMASDDAAAMGAEPISITNGLAVNTLGKKDDHPNKRMRIARNMNQLSRGLKVGSEKAGLVVENGETAEHGDSQGGYGEFVYDWFASVSYIANRSRLIDGRKIKTGAAVVALADEGFGCNGYTLLLKQLEQVHGYEWHHQEFGDDSTWGQELLRPSRIYTALFVALSGGYRPDVEPFADVQSLVHVTGGGIPGKLGSKLNGTGHGAELNDLFEPSAAMLKFQELAKLDDEEMHHVFHMGQRGLVITNEPYKVIAEAAIKGIPAKIAGEITNNPEIVVNSKGLTNYGDGLVFPLAA